MKVNPTPIDGLIEILPTVYSDERGFFKEIIHPKKFAEIGIRHRFVQMNHSKSVKGTLRGLHFQTYPYSQSKLVRCIRGCIYDVAVDLRPNSPTFLQFYGVELTEDNHKILYVPVGFAHGFLAVTDCEIEYACGDVYAQKYEDGILWNDTDLNIPWPLNEMNPIVSQKDASLDPLVQVKKRLV
jgi:dTDP-4-dehydrorhamnose 3,5-epimerase